MSVLTKSPEGAMRVTADTKNATRKRILEVAQKLFTRQGFEATTTRDIAREADIAAGTLFNYFPTKESIVACLLSDASICAAEVFTARFNRDRPVDADSDDAVSQAAEPPSLEEDLFAYV